MFILQVATWMMPRRFLSLLLLLPLVVTAAECPYESYATDGAILVADTTYCLSTAPVCAVDTSCRRLLSHKISRDQVKFSGYSALGNLTAYPHDELYIGNASYVNANAMELPSTLLTLSFDNVTAISLGVVYSDLIDNITELYSLRPLTSTWSYALLT
ncbi:hypothetical protein SPRG_18278 [Saprolegnia parasitica CBS 223.65]|uniref:Peptidase A1 domain-containing protein n=1 Tax=Saprolegnia parasitica (strain CBS 223.65) TaxID=695850 RepID=A0A067BHK7_SAPPC|nr:hypothetical protein SPRG_18278 [Saprolegnia parasitica CBS 223.65]KDO16185.1 hypothetical protein SPRG_18278 [Saprolegnia parasitica CBS 223.65]|eukprot:XP_012213106.1 hypothetical protein SPRG_18278 [Saprolegnia parasitica CBS 223.65]